MIILGVKFNVFSEKSIVEAIKIKKSDPLAALF